MGVTHRDYGEDGEGSGKGGEEEGQRVVGEWDSRVGGDEFWGDVSGEFGECWRREGGGGGNWDDTCPDCPEVEDREGQRVAKAKKDAVAGFEAVGEEGAGGGSGEVEEVRVAERFVSFWVEDDQRGFVEARGAGDDVSGEVEGRRDRGEGAGVDLGQHE